MLTGECDCLPLPRGELWCVGSVPSSFYSQTHLDMSQRHGLVPAQVSLAICGGALMFCDQIRVETSRLALAAPDI